MEYARVVWRGNHGAYMGDIGIVRGNIKMNPDETNCSWDWNGFDLVQRSLASFVKEGDKPSAPLNFKNRASYI
jgi:hypothetical protein